MAKLLFIEDYQTVQELVSELSQRDLVVLVSKKLFEAQGIDPDEAQELIRSYDCGGDADVYLDIVTSPNHYFFTRLQESNDG